MGKKIDIGTRVYWKQYKNDYEYEVKKGMVVGFAGTYCKALVSNAEHIGTIKNPYLMFDVSELWTVKEYSEYLRQPKGISLDAVFEQEMM